MAAPISWRTRSSRLKDMTGSKPRPTSADSSAAGPGGGFSSLGDRFPAKCRKFGQLSETKSANFLNLTTPAGTNAQAPNYRRQRGAFTVPVLRYFLVMGCCLLGLLFAADYLLPQAELAPQPAAANTAQNGTLASWRQTQQRLDRPQAAAVVYPDTAPMAPTAERLQWERQMTYRRA